VQALPPRIRRFEVNESETTTGNVWPFATGPIPPDSDADGDVDLEDFAIFHACVSGADVPADPHCAD